MSLYQPTALAVSAYVQAQRPVLAGEMDVLLSSEEVANVGQFTFTNPSSGTYAADAVGGAIINAVPSDLQAVVYPTLKSAVQVVLTISGTDQAGAALGGTATIKPPPWVQDQTFDFATGYAVDVIAPATKLFKTVTAVYATGGSSGSKVELKKLPTRTTFVRVGCTTNMNFGLKSAPAVPIACGMDGSKYVKRGRSEPATLTITAKYVSFADGLARYAGRNCTAMIEIEKDGNLLTDRLVFGGFIPSVKADGGDGQDEVTQSVEGLYETLLGFTAG